MAITLANTGVIYPDSTQLTTTIYENIYTRLTLSTGSSTSAGNVVSINSNNQVIGYPNTVLSGGEVVSSNFTYGNNYTLSADGTCGIYLYTNIFAQNFTNVAIRGVGIGNDGTETLGLNTTYANTIVFTVPGASGAPINNFNYWVHVHDGKIVSENLTKSFPFFKY